MSQEGKQEGIPDTEMRPGKWQGMGKLLWDYAKNNLQLLFPLKAISFAVIDF